MDNSGRLFSQVAAEAKVSADQAMIACYLQGLSRDGRTLDDAARLLRKDRCEVRNYARDWGIPFADYKPADRPRKLVWVKVKRGEWELRDGDEVIAAAGSDGKGSYTAGMMIDGKRVSYDGSTAEIAAKRLSREIDRRSVALFGVDDVEIIFAPTGNLLAPVVADNADNLRRALAA